VAGTFVTFVDPGRALGPAISRLTGIRPEDLEGAPPLADAMRGLSDFLGADATLLGHNVAFDAAFLERAGLNRDLGRLDTVELASIVLPTASSYALQRLAADEGILPEAAHRALHDALTCAGVLNALARHARRLPPQVLEECRLQSALLGPAYVAFFENALVTSWSGAGAASFSPNVARGSGRDGPGLTLARSKTLLPGHAAKIRSRRGLASAVPAAPAPTCHAASSAFSKNSTYAGPSSADCRRHSSSTCGGSARACRASAFSTPAQVRASWSARCAASGRIASSAARRWSA